MEKKLEEYHKEMKLLVSQKNLEKELESVWGILNGLDKYCQFKDLQDHMDKVHPLMVK